MYSSEELPNANRSNNSNERYISVPRISHDWQYNNNGDYGNIEEAAGSVTEHSGGISPLIPGHPNRP